MTEPDRQALSNFLATDDVPDSIFGIPVVSREEDYTEADLAFFQEHPEAGGYYDLGEGTPDDGSAEGAPVQNDGKPYVDMSKLDNSADRAVGDIINYVSAMGLVPTGRALHRAGFMAYDGKRGVVASADELKKEAARRWTSAQNHPNPLKNFFTEGRVTPAHEVDGKTETAFYPKAKAYIPGSAPTEETRHAMNFDTTDARVNFPKTFTTGARISNKDAKGRPIGTITNYVAGPGNERNTAMSGLIPFAYAFYKNQLNTPKKLAEFWDGVWKRAVADGNFDSYAKTFDFPGNSRGLVRAFLEARSTIESGKLGPENPKMIESKALIDWLLNADEINRITKAEGPRRKAVV